MAAFECDSSACYLLMEDKASGGTGRFMTMSHSSSSTPAGPAAARTSTFSGAPRAPHTVMSAVEAEDVVPQLPDFSQNSPLQSARKKTGILRQSSSTDSAEDGPPPTRRVKKQVSITLPRSSTRPVVPPRQRAENSTSHTLDGSDDGTSGRPQEIVVEVDVHDNTEHTLGKRFQQPEKYLKKPHSETVLEDESGGFAVELLNGDLREREQSEPDLILLRENPRPRQDSKRKSMRQSLTSSLSRIGNRMRGRKPPKLQRLQSALDFNELAQNELELKANLYWHIGTPIKRWKVEGQVPIKLILQLLKTFCLIVQVILFTGTISHKRAEFFFDSRIVFESLFIVNFDPESVLQEQTLYNIEQVSQELEFIATNYYKLPDTTIGGYDLVRDESGEPVPLRFRLQQYREANLNASERRFVLDGNVEEIFFNFSGSDENVAERLFSESQDPRFQKFIDLRVSLPVNVIRIEAPQKAECYRFNVMILFVNDDHNGKILYSLHTDYHRLDCDGTILKDKTSYDVVKGVLVSLDFIVLGFCVISLVLTAKTLRRAYRLGKAMGQFYHKHLNLPLSWWERRSLFSPWHYFNITSDFLISSGTLYKILLEFEVVLGASMARILLGSALLFQAAVILRYINYFKQVNALTRTLALAFPELVKFLLCGAVLFFAFAICGWIVLGPFHPKFQNFNDSVETLFALLNGDDIYNTYILIEPQVDLAAYIYSRFFLYTFLGLFVYAVLNLFTSLIISAHEISQNKDTATGNEVRRFVFSGPLTPRGGALRDVTSTCKYVKPELILNKAQKKKEYSSDDDQYE